MSVLFKKKKKQNISQCELHYKEKCKDQKSEWICYFKTKILQNFTYFPLGNTTHLLFQDLRIGTTKDRHLLGWDMYLFCTIKVWKETSFELFLSSPYFNSHRVQ